MSYSNRGGLVPPTGQAVGGAFPGLPLVGQFAKRRAQAPGRGPLWRRSSSRERKVKIPSPAGREAMTGPRSGGKNYENGGALGPGRRNT